MENIPEQKVSSMSPRKSTKNIYWISIGIIVLLIIAVVIYIYVINKNQENNLIQQEQNLSLIKPEVTDKENVIFSSPVADSRECQIDTLEWQTHESGEYTIKYPQNWFTVIETPDENSPVKWFNSYGYNDLGSLVYIGGHAQVLSALEQYLNFGSDPIYSIESRDEVIIDGIQATRLTVSSSSYPEYYYYIPVGNIPQIIRGPRESDTFKNCEAEIFEKMIESYEYRGIGPRV